MSIFVTDISMVRQIMQGMNDKDNLLEHISAILDDTTMSDKEKLLAIQRVLQYGEE